MDNLIEFFYASRWSGRQAYFEKEDPSIEEFQETISDLHSCPTERGLIERMPNEAGLEEMYAARAEIMPVPYWISLALCTPVPGMTRHLDAAAAAAILTFLQEFPSEADLRAELDKDVSPLATVYREEFYKVLPDLTDLGRLHGDIENVMARVIDLLVAECHDETCEGGGDADLRPHFIELVRIVEAWGYTMQDAILRHVHACWDCWRQATGIGAADAAVGPKMFELDWRAPAKGWKNDRRFDPLSSHHKTLNKLGHRKMVTEQKPRAGKRRP